MGTDKAKEPNGDNFAVIKKIALEVMQSRSLCRPNQIADLIEETKQECANLQIDYGRHDSVAFNVVHRAAAWAQVQHLKARTPAKAVNA